MAHRFGPTSPRSARSGANLDDIDKTVAQSLELLHQRLQPADDSPEDAALCILQNFCRVALAVMRKTNASKIRSEARSAEIGARMAGQREMVTDLFGLGGEVGR